MVAQTGEPTGPAGRWPEWLIGSDFLELLVMNTAPTLMKETSTLISLGSHTGPLLIYFSFVSLLKANHRRERGRELEKAGELGCDRDADPWTCSGSLYRTESTAWVWSQTHV